jgi:hypothetical protein
MPPLYPAAQFRIDLLSDTSHVWRARINRLHTIAVT